MLTVTISTFGDLLLYGNITSCFYTVIMYRNAASLYRITLRICFLCLKAASLSSPVPARWPALGGGRTRVPGGSCMCVGRMWCMCGE